MATPYLSEIKLFAGTFVPRGWMPCDGRLLSIAQYDALFNLIGTTYGGDGQETFALPDLRGRVPLHAGQSPGTSNYVLGQTSGVEQVTLTTNQMPAHNHPVLCSSAGTNPALMATKTTPANNFPGTESSGAGIYEISANSTMNAGMIGSAGGAQPHENMQPYLAIKFIISVEGIFPPRLNGSCKSRKTKRSTIYHFMHLNLNRVFVLALAALLVFAGRLSAQQLIISTSSSIPANDRLMRVNVNDNNGGSNIFAGAVAFSNPNGVAADVGVGKFFVADGVGTNCIRAGNLNGTGSVTNLVNVGVNISGLALDTVAQRIYFTTSSSFGANDQVMRVNYNGTGLVTLFSGGAISNANGIAIDASAGKLFVADATGVLAANLNGTGTITNLYSAGFNVTAVAADTVNQRIYFTYASPFSTARVLRVNYNGSSPLTLFTNSGTMSNPNGLALDVSKGKMYIADGNGGNGVRVANLDGTGTPATLYAAGINVSGVTPVQNLLYITGTATNQATLDTASLNPFSGVTIGNSSGSTITLSIQLDNPAKGSFTSLGGFTAFGGGFYAYSGSAASCTAAIRSMVYKPTRDRVIRGLTETSFFTITANDGSLPVTDKTTTVISTAANHPPVANANRFDHPARTAMIIPTSVLPANDTDQDSDALTLQSVDATSALGVPVSISGTNVIYGASTNLATDTFNYVVNDAHGGTATGLVTITSSSASISLAGANKVLKFTRSPSLTYRVQYSTNLSTTNWITLASILSDPTGQLAYTNVSPADPYRFYRAINP